MRRLKQVLLALSLTAGAFPQLAISETLTFINSKGENIEFKVEENDCFFDVLKQIQCYDRLDHLANKTIADEMDYLPSNEGIRLNDSQFDFLISHAGVTIRSKTNWRDYNSSVRSKEKEDITYIVTTLANDSLLSIGASQSSLKKAGKRIDHLHPFRFLMTVFTDERLKAGIHAIRDRGGWVGNGFIDGLVGSLNEEANRGNLLQFTGDFAQKVRINSDLILPYLQQGRWKEFINVLIDTIPREIDPTRYNI